MTKVVQIERRRKVVQIERRRKVVQIERRRKVVQIERKRKVRFRSVSNLSATGYTHVCG